MLFGALGCNLAWGIIDAGVYLLARLNDQGRKILMLRAMREAPDLETAQQIMAGALPPLLASALLPEQLELMRQKLRELARAAMAAATGEARLDRSPGSLFAQLRFNVSDCRSVHFHWRGQVGAARLQRRRHRDAVLVRLCVWIQERTSPLGNGACNGGYRWRACRRRNSSRRIRALAAAASQLRQADLGKWRAHKGCLDQCRRRPVACAL